MITMKRYFIIRNEAALRLLCKRYPQGIAHKSKYSYYRGTYKSPPVFEVEGDYVWSWCYKEYYTRTIGAKEEEFITFSDYVKLTKT